ncbi:MAG: murein hydrolase activator EnvC [Patescibacteria group bacterium]
MRIFTKILLLSAALAIVLFGAPWLGGTYSNAQSTDETLEKLSQEIEQYESEIAKLKSQASTLSNQIAQYDAQIRLTSLKIEETEEKIALLGGRIGQLEESLDALTNAFASRAVLTYKMARLNQPYLILVSAKDLNDAVSSFHYLQKIQEADRGLLVRLEEAQINYKEEKVDQEGLQIELEEQKSFLGVQKAAKANLLAVTKNDEKRYQELLKKARAELAAIQAIIAGKGDETKVREVNEGEKIASILTFGPNLDACSTGSHLHFEVVKDRVYQNPFSFLSKRSLMWDNIDPPQNGSGSWNWPLNDPIRITQGYGQTSYSGIYAGHVHTGVDMTNDDNREVKSVKKGTLYRGGISCGGGTLQYVRVQQDDGYDTYYLHVSY